MASPATTKAKKKVRKAPPKKGKKGRKKKAEPVVVTADMLAAIPLFAPLERPLLERLATRVEHLDLERTEHLFDGAPAGGDDDSPVFVLTFGDVSVHRTTADGERVVNYLRPGDAYVQKLFVDGSTQKLRLTAMCPIRALRLKYRDVNYLAHRDFKGPILGATHFAKSRWGPGYARPATPPGAPGLGPRDILGRAAS